MTRCKSLTVPFLEQKEAFKHNLNQNRWVDYIVRHTITQIFIQLVRNKVFIDEERESCED